MGRPVEWDGFVNTRDLGGLPRRSGATTAARRLYRSATLRFVTQYGWDEAWTAGVRTIVDLRNDDEVGPRRSAADPGSAVLRDGEPTSDPPPATDRVRVPLDDVDDVGLRQTIRSEGLDGTPLYYRLFLRRKPDRCAAVNRAIARARPGGVLFHCGAGRDRTGLVAVLLLSLGCEARGHRRDYEESSQALPALFAAVGVPDQAPVTERALRAHGTTAYDAVVDMLDHADAEAVLRDGGLSDDDIAAARHRLLP